MHSYIHYAFMQVYECYMCVYTGRYVPTYVYMCVCVYVCIDVCMYSCTGFQVLFNASLITTLLSCQLPLCRCSSSGACVVAQVESDDGKVLFDDTFESEEVGETCLVPEADARQKSLVLPSRPSSAVMRLAVPASKMCFCLSVLSVCLWVSALSSFNSIR